MEFDKQGCTCNLTKWPEEVCPWKEHIFNAQIVCDCCPYCRTICMEHVLDDDDNRT